MVTFADVDNILASANGQFRGPVYDGVHQCLAWAAFYSGAIGNASFLPTPVSNGARDVYEQFPAPLPSQYTRIPNDAAFVPQKGDIVVWTGMPGNSYGHIAVANGVGNTSTFQSYDQNWSRGQAVTLITHNYNYVLGVLRPKNLTQVSNQGGSMKPTISQIRYIHVDSEGWDWKKSMNGDYDQMFNDSWAWRSLDELLSDKWSTKNDNWRQIRQTALDYYNNVRPGLETQLKSQQDQIAKLTADLAASQANDANDAAQIAKLEDELKNVPNAPHQDSAQAAAIELKPAVSWIKRVIEWLGK